MAWKISKEYGRERKCTYSSGSVGRVGVACGGRVGLEVEQDTVNQVDNTVVDDNVRSDDLSGRVARHDIGTCRVSHELELFTSGRGVVGRGELGRLGIRWWLECTCGLGTYVDDGTVNDVVQKDILDKSSVGDLTQSALSGRAKCQ